MENQGLFIVNALIKATKRKLKKEQNKSMISTKKLSQISFLGTIFSPIYAATVHRETIQSLGMEEKKPITPEEWITFFKHKIPLTTNMTYKGFNRGLSSFVLNENI